MRGTAVVGGFGAFAKKYGSAAVHEVYSRLSPIARHYVQPHATNFGLLGTRSYPYPVVGELLRTMCLVVRANEDDFVRAIATAAMEASLSTVNRVVLRYLASLSTLSARAQEAWDLFHDSGRLRIVTRTDHEYVVEVSEWPNHDAMVCRLSMEGRRLLVEKTGIAAPELFRDKCQSWGQEVCVSRIRWK